MLKTIHAVFEGGVFRPIEAVDLPEHTAVEIQVKEKPPMPSLDDVYAILRRSYSTGERDLAERHNEHQP